MSGKRCVCEGGGGVKDQIVCNFGLSVATGLTSLSQITQKQN